MQKNEGIKVVKWILIAVSVLFAFVFLILPLYTVISVALRNGVEKYFQYITDKDTISAVKLYRKSNFVGTCCKHILRTVCGMVLDNVPV